MDQAGGLVLCVCKNCCVNARVDDLIRPASNMLHYDFKAQIGYQHNVLEWKKAKLRAIDHNIAQIFRTIVLSTIGYCSHASIQILNPPWNESKPANCCVCTMKENLMMMSTKPFPPRARLKSINGINGTTRKQLFVATKMCFALKRPISNYFSAQRHTNRARISLRYWHERASI